MLAQTLRAMLAPAGLLILAFVFRPQVAALPEPQQALAVYLPLALILSAMAFSWIFHRSRVFFALTVLALAYTGLWSISFPTAETGFRAEVMQSAVALLLPLNITLLALSKERGITTPRGALRLLLLLSQVLLVTWIIKAQATEPLTYLERDWLDPDWFRWTSLPQYALFALGLALLVLLARYLVHRNPLDAGLLGVVMALVPVMNDADDATTTAVFFCAAALIMTVALIQESYGMAYLDELTGLPGRRALRQTFLQLGSHYALAMVDVDHFKKFNDTYGHDVGDQVLRMVATRLRKVSGGGKAFRYGGEEFTVVFPGKDVVDVLAHLDALRLRIEETPFAIRGKNRPRRAPEKKTRRAGVKQVAITVSIGVAQRDERCSLPEEVLKTADQALYQAKKRGRNQVCRGVNADARRGSARPRA